jgi:bifunctional non-homologous end joining protein LigD
LCSHLKADFYEVMGRHGLRDEQRIARAAVATPATFIGFDVIETAGQRRTALPLVDRKVILADLVRPANWSHRSLDQWGRRCSKRWQPGIWRALSASGYLSSYRLDHRSTDWVKVKTWRTRQVTILGVRFEPKFGVLVGEPGGSPLCVVGLGWTPTDRSALVRLLPELSPRQQGDVTWVKPVLQARIRYRVTPTGRIREPVWSGFALAA